MTSSQLCKVSQAPRVNDAGPARSIRQKQAQQTRRRFPQLLPWHLDHGLLRARYGYRPQAIGVWPLGFRV